MDEIKRRINEIKLSLENSIGYPVGTYDYSEIVEICSTQINNIGSPELSSSYRANTKETELEVIKWFSDLWHIQNYWGYITNGGTEANLQGLYVGRETANGCKHIFMTSADSHYSIFKIAKLLSLNICIINSQDNGEIDYQDFEEKLIQNPNTYVIINANLGTTMKGAIDNTRNIYRIIKKHKRKCYVHADAALSGFFLPFLENDLYFKSHINSIAISCHKFLGVPFPCGVFIMEKYLLEHISNNIEYIGTVDCMISGSRNGHSSLFIKYMIDKKGMIGFKTDIEKCIELAEYTVNNIQDAYRNQNSITVVIPRPNEKICYKWQLACQGDIAHLVIMPHVTFEKINIFLTDLNNEVINN